MRPPQSAAFITFTVPAVQASLSILLPNRWLTAKWHMPRKVAGTAAKGMEGWGKFQEGLIVRCQIVVALFLLLAWGTGASAEWRRPETTKCRRWTGFESTSAATCNASLPATGLRIAVQSFGD